MCGILGIVGTTDVAAALYDGLTVLQHRGQDAAGIATVSGHRINLHKGNGLVSDVFGPKQMQLLQGKVGIGHCRYPTAGSSGSDEAQPFYANAPFGISLAHNGNLTNTVALRQEVFEQDRRHINTQSDSEVLLNVLAHELLEQGSISPQSALLAVEGVHRRVRGGYSVVATVIGLGLLAFRDPHGIRPLVIGKRESELGNEYAIASESAALDILGFTRLRDVAPGEAVVVTEQGRLVTHNAAPNQKHTPCIFEFVYFARPDSMMDDISVHKARMRMGVKLGEKILRLRPDHDIDTVIPIPDTSRDAALEIANILGVKYREGFIKNRYIGRTFIMPGQSQRVRSVKRKLNPMPLEFKDRVVLLVDDSIVRGTTSQQIVQMAREAGARKVYLASAAPPVRFPNVYGIDMPAATELVAHGRTEDEIQQVLGCDWLIYQDIADLEEAVSGPKHKISHFDSSCFTGEYITGIDSGYFEKLEIDRSDAAKSTQI
ncbi:MAG TPA: amidophosphoribosyltransferase [Arenimonas sp.]|nr:amidophosphoribosyltransferase [Arenimonas sp.]